MNSKAAITDDQTSQIGLFTAGVIQLYCMHLSKRPAEKSCENPQAMEMLRDISQYYSAWPNNVRHITHKLDSKPRNLVMCVFHAFAIYFYTNHTNGYNTLPHDVQLTNSRSTTLVILSYNDSIVPNFKCIVIDNFRQPEKNKIDKLRRRTTDCIDLIQVGDDSLPSLLRGGMG